MNTRRVWLWIVGGVVLVIAVLVVGVRVMFGRSPSQSSELYEDPQGRFTMQVDPSWEQVETDGRFAQFKVPDPPLTMYFLVIDASTIEEAYSQAFNTLGFDPGLLEGGGYANFGDWQAYTQTDAAELTYGLAGQIVGDKAYVLVVKADKPGVSADNAVTMRVLNSMKIAGNGDANENA